MQWLKRCIMYMSDICGYSDVVYFVNFKRILFRKDYFTSTWFLKTCHVPFSVISAHKLDLQNLYIIISIILFLLTYCLWDGEFV